MNPWLSLALKDALAWGVAGALTFAAAHPLWRRHRRAQDRISDLLRTDTPGGLADLADLLRNRAAAGKGRVR